MRRARHIDLALSAAVRRLPGVTAAPSRFGGGVAYRVDGREFVHWHSDAEVDLRLTRRRIRAMLSELESDPRVALRHGDSEWISVRLGSRADVAFVARLAALAAQANRRG